jgi:hypothetical protein
MRSKALKGRVAKKILEAKGPNQNRLSDNLIEGQLTLSQGIVKKAMMLQLMKMMMMR